MRSQIITSLRLNTTHPAMKEDKKREQFIGMLIEHLCLKGIEVTPIPSFIRYVAHELIANPYASTKKLSRHLQLSGWDTVELDDFTLYLILGIFEPDLARTVIEDLNPSFMLESPLPSVKKRTDLNIS
jgi:hypothetical protein